MDRGDESALNLRQIVVEARDAVRLLKWRMRRLFPFSPVGVHWGNNTVLARTIFGQPIFVDTRDVIIGHSIVGRGWFEAHVTAVLLNLVRPNHVFVDIGANIGIYSLLMAWRAPHGRGFAFEPNPNLFRLLVDSIEINNYHGRVTPIQKGVGETSGMAELKILERNYGSATLRPLTADQEATATARHNRAIETVGVPVVTLDEALADVPSIDVMKVDVEGFEPAVFRGAQDILRRSPNIAIVMEFSPALMGPEETGRLLDQIGELGFRLHLIPRVGRVRPIERGALPAVNAVDLLLRR